MAIEFTEAALIYSGSQISGTHKVPVGEKYIIRIGLHVTKDVILFIPVGFDKFITSDGKRFCCKENDEVMGGDLNG